MGIPDFHAENADLSDTGEMVPGTIERAVVARKPLLGFGNASVDLTVRVEPAGAPSYEASYVLHVPEADVPAAGKRVAVFRDRANPARILVDLTIDDAELAETFHPDLDALIASAPPDENSASAS